MDARIDQTMGALYGGPQIILRLSGWDDNQMGGQGDLKRWL